MDLRELVESWKKILQVSSKPGKHEYMAVLKITMLGLFLIGVIAFIVRVIFYTLLFPYTG